MITRWRLQLCPKMPLCGCPGCSDVATAIPACHNNIGQDPRQHRLVCRFHVHDARWRYPSTPDRWKP